MPAIARRLALALLASGLCAGAYAQALPDAKPPPLPPGATRPHLDASRCRGGSAFAVRNQDGLPITQLYIRPSGTTGGMDRNLIEGRVLKLGQQFEIDPGIGRFDILVLRMDGTGVVAPRQNPCAVSMIGVSGSRFSSR